MMISSMKLLPGVTRTVKEKQKSYEGIIFKHYGVEGKKSVIGYIGHCDLSITELLERGFKFDKKEWARNFDNISRE